MSERETDSATGRERVARVPFQSDTERTAEAGAASGIAMGRETESMAQSESGAASTAENDRAAERATETEIEGETAASRRLSKCLRECNQLTSNAVVPAPVRPNTRSGRCNYAKLSSSQKSSSRADRSVVGGRWWGSTRSPRQDAQSSARTQKRF